LIFVATLTHTPELCFGNKEYQAEGKEWVQEMRSRAKKHNVNILGAYLAPNEHTFYFVLESNDFVAVSELLGPPMITHHSAKVSPVITPEQAFGLSFVE
jgi:L-rhamnose mutarotase